MRIDVIDCEIKCNKCDFSFVYKASGAHCKIDQIYDKFLKDSLTSCPHCYKGMLTVSKGEYKLDLKKVKYTADWKCSICGQRWSQVKYFGKDKSLTEVIDSFSEDYTNKCPNKYCGVSSHKHLLAVTK